VAIIIIVLVRSFESNIASVKCKKNQRDTKLWMPEIELSSTRYKGDYVDIDKSWK
jgi:hypothetical protein